MMTILPDSASAQDKKDSGYMEYIIEGKDTIYVDYLRASKVVSRHPKMKGKEWKKYYRLVYNFNKTYPYALAARKVVADADSTIAADGLKRGKKERYLKSVQEELFADFEKPLKNLTITQGALLMKLIDRECGMSSFSLIKDYRNPIAAGFWQGVAKLFKSDLKKRYDPEGDDLLTEELVQKWEKGEFDDFYYSLFWEYPAKTELPSKYR